MKHFLLMVAAMAMLATSCQVNYEKTKSGLVYKIHHGKNGEAIKPGQFVKFNIEYSIPEKKDTILNSTYGKIPGYGQVDTSARVAYSFMELLPLCKEGDSVVFTISVDTLKKLNPSFEYNELLTRGGKIQGKLSVLKVFKNENEVQQDYEAELKKEMEREVNYLQQYLAKKGVKAQKTKNGTFVEIQTFGDTATAKADSGKQVTIMYKGYVLESNKVFDTNMDTTKGHTEPLQLVLGQGRVIPGWEEGIPYFGKGGKGKLYIPAMMGYGMQGAGADVPPYANLVFEVEVTDVKQAPTQPTQNLPQTFK